MSEETLFQEALAKSPGERGKFLDAVCAGQPQLCAAIEALLAAHEGSGSQLHRTPVPLGRADVTVEYHVTTIEPGRMVAGRYTLLDKVGEGGMGEVWVARQTEPVKRKVALKLIKTGMDSRAVLTRFEQERQALALMDHPNIARVLDGGLTRDARPFFVMELVNGLPLTKFCDEVRLTTRQRLELFVPICQAVQHAHQKGIIHRDLKPANILVTVVDGKPVPKVIDFGVAKATSGKLTDESLFTQFGAVVGTLEYMAPEQAGYAGADIDTRADIYSLGVILYELLTGLRPFDPKRLKDTEWTEMVRILREEEPSKPSTRISTEKSLQTLAALRQTEPKKLLLLLRGELDWIVMKCLEKQRDRRYETANGLARDVQRYLADEPVEARSPTARYRLGKFLRRNKGPALAVSLVLLALVAGMVGTTLGMLHAERRRVEAEQAHQQEAVQRAKAEKARDRTRQALDAMTSSVTEDSLATQSTISEEQKKFLTEVLTYYREFAGEEAEDERSRDRTAEAAHRVGLIERRLGRMEEALAAIRIARDGFEELAAEFPGEPEYRWDLARSLGNLGITLYGMGKLSEAEKQIRRSVYILENLIAELPTLSQYRKHLALCRLNLGVLLNNLGKRSEAEQQYRQALALQEKLAAEFPDLPEHREQLALIRYNLGSLLDDLNNHREAEQQFRTNLDVLEKLVADFPAAAKYRASQAKSHFSLAGVLKNLGRRPQAEQQYLKALAIQEKLTVDFPSSPEFRDDRAYSHHHLGVLLKDMGKYAEAEKQYRQALAIQQQLMAEVATVPEYRSNLARSYNSLGSLLKELTRRGEAEKQYRQALAIQEKLVTEFPAVPQYRQELGHSHNRLGILLAGVGRQPEAEAHFHLVLAHQEKLAAEFPSVPRYRSELASSHHNLGLLLKDLGRGAQAEEHYHQALAIQEKLATEFAAVPKYQIDLALTLLNLGHLLREDKRTGESLDYYDKAIRTYTPVYEQNPAWVFPKRCLCQSYVGRAAAHETLRQYTEALADWDKTIELSSPAEQPGLRARRAMAHGRADQLAEAVAEIAELTKSSSWDAGQWYDFACVYAVASVKFTDKKQEYGQRAVEMLHKAVKGGWKDAAHMQKDPDLAPLHERDDFKKLIRQLEEKSVVEKEK